ncbi:MAG: thiamine phosphate synthase [Pedobacter sp.]
MTRKDISGLYLITESLPDMMQRVRTALENGVKIVQYRDKSEDRKQRFNQACELRTMCRDFEALFIVNNDPELALACRADGVHLGQSDGSVARARKLLGTGSLIGVSTHCLKEAMGAQQQGADYIGFGCLFPSVSKQDTVATSLQELSRVRAAVTVPIVAIGGIHLGNAALAIRAGADAVAVISAVMQADDAAAAVCALHRQVQEGRSNIL